MIYALVALGTVVAILAVFRLLTIISKRRNRLTATQVADKIERHIEGTEGPMDWDGFTSIPITDDRLDAIRLLCIKLDDEPPEKRAKELKEITDRLRAGGA